MRNPTIKNPARAPVPAGLQKSPKRRRETLVEFIGMSGALVADSVCIRLPMRQGLVVDRNQLARIGILQRCHVDQHQPIGEDQRDTELEQIFGHSGSLFRRAVGAAQIGPIDIRAEVFAADGADRFTLDIYRQRFPALPPISYVAQLAERRVTAGGKTVALLDRHGKVEVF